MPDDPLGQRCFSSCKGLPLTDIEHQVDPHRLPLHVAIIMDGNGRWAQQRGLNRIQGHQEGASSVRVVVETARELGIRYLTLYAFSEENWQRPRTEIKALMGLLQKYLRQEQKEMMANGIAFRAIGDLTQLPSGIQRDIAAVQAATAANAQMTLILALSYGGRSEIVHAARQLMAEVQAGRMIPAELTHDIFARHLFTADLPDPDLLIRTSGEHRVSNFLLWQLAYTELYFSDTLWPDFRKAEFLQALLSFQQRQRRFGLTQEQIERQAAASRF